MAKVLFYKFMDLDEVEVYQHRKKEANNPVILTEQAWQMKDLLLISKTKI